MSVEVALDPRTACPQCKAVFRGGFPRCPRDGSPLHALTRDPLVDTVLADRYHVESLIGEGGLGRVYRARHVRMSRRYAIKVPFGDLAYDAKVRTRFANEAEATSRLRHPNVIGVVDVGETPEGLLYMAMDLAEGESLAQVIDRDGPMPADRVRRIALQLARGLEHAHERGLVHRDLKPENIILEPAEDGETVRIVDFGIAILRDASGSPTNKLTTEGIVLGTPHYMAPEQAIAGDIDHRVDIFALGLILYEMLAGTLPFSGTPVEVARQNLSAEPPRIAARVPGLVVDPALEAIAFRMLAKQPAARPQHLREVIGLLEASASEPERVLTMLGAVTGGAGDAAPMSGVEPAPTPDARTATEAAPVVADAAVSAPPPARGRRGVAVAAAIAALLLGGVALWLATRPDEPARAAAVVDAAPAAATAPLDAAVAMIAVDAGVPDVAPVDAAPPPDAGRRAPADVRRAPDAGARRTPPPAAAPDAGPRRDDEPPAAAPTKASLTALYEQVGTAIDRLHREQGADAAASFKRRYEQIAYLDAVRNPDIRVEVMRRLRALDAEVARALR